MLEVKKMWKMAIHNNMMDAPDFNRVWRGWGSCNIASMDIQCKVEDASDL